MALPKGFKPPSEPSESEKPKKWPLSWRERKLRCKLGFHSNAEDPWGSYPYICKLCGKTVYESGGDEE